MEKSRVLLCLNVAQKISGLLKNCSFIKIHSMSCGLTGIHALGLSTQKQMVYQPIFDAQKLSIKHTGLFLLVLVVYIHRGVR